MPQNPLKSKSSLRKILVTLQLPAAQTRSQENIYGIYHQQPEECHLLMAHHSLWGMWQLQKLFQTWEEIQVALIVQVRFFFSWCFTALLCKNEIQVGLVIHIPMAEQTCWGFCFWERNPPICIPRATAIATGAPGSSSRRRRKQGWINNSGFKTGKKERSAGGEAPVVETSARGTGGNLWGKCET